MEEKELTEYLERLGNKIYRLAFSYLKNTSDAEDAVQDVLIKRMEYNRPFESAEHETAWTIRVTVNLCKNRLKSHSYRHTVSLSEETAMVEMPPEENEVLEAILKLPEKYRTVVHLHYYEGYKTAEIADILQKKESSIRSILHRARAQLKEILMEVTENGETL